MRWLREAAKANSLAGLDYASSEGHQRNRHQVNLQQKAHKLIDVEASLVALSGGTGIAAVLTLGLSQQCDTNSKSKSRKSVETI